MEKFFYRVQNGESISAIAERFGVPIGVIISLNNLKEDVSEGDLIYIEKESCSLYKVRPFDTAKSVAARFNVAEEELLEKNGVPYLFYGLIIKI